MSGEIIHRKSPILWPILSWSSSVRIVSILRSLPSEDGTYRIIKKSLVVKVPRYKHRKRVTLTLILEFHRPASAAQLVTCHGGSSHSTKFPAVRNQLFHQNPHRRNTLKPSHHHNPNQPPKCLQNA